MFPSLCLPPQSSSDQLLMSSQKWTNTSRWSDFLPPSTPPIFFFSSNSAKLRTLLCNLLFPPLNSFWKPFHVSEQRSTSCFDLTGALVVCRIWGIPDGACLVWMSLHGCHAHTWVYAQQEYLEGDLPRIKGCATFSFGVYRHFPVLN